jgi:perosamine synthetase|tara:strand:- start:1186 stop:2310 length:1125 start_codon:yes stop_codon:yes gene_type:complete
MIPVNRPLIYSKNNIEIEKSLSLKWISGDGPIVKKFEQKFSKIIGSKFGVTVSNGTAALEVALAALKLKPGSKVIVPNLTIISCLNAILRNNLKPVFVDVNETDFNICISDLKKKVNKNIKALIMVHTYGLPSNVGEIMLLKKKFNFKVIEDCAEGIGLKYKNKYLGRYGDLSIFSFYSNKLITTGEGGCILTDSKKYYNRCLSLRNLSFGKNERFKHQDLSGNYRLSSLQCAYGLSQLKYFSNHIKKKKEIGAIYNKRLKNKPFIKIPLIKNETSENIYWVYPIVIKKKGRISKDSFIKFMNNKGVATRDFFYPLSQQPLLRKHSIKNKILKTSNFLYNNGLYLPSGLGNTFSEIKKVCNLIDLYEKRFFKKR